MAKKKFNRGYATTSQVKKRPDPPAEPVKETPIKEPEPVIVQDEWSGWIKAAEMEVNKHFDTAAQRKNHQWMRLYLDETTEEELIQPIQEHWSTSPLPIHPQILLQGILLLKRWNQSQQVIIKCLTEIQDLDQVWKWLCIHVDRLELPLGFADKRPQSTKEGFESTIVTQQVSDCIIEQEQDQESEVEPSRNDMKRWILAQDSDSSSDTESIASVELEAKAQSILNALFEKVKGAASQQERQLFGMRISQLKRDIAKHTLPDENKLNELLIVPLIPEPDGSDSSDSSQYELVNGLDTQDSESDDLGIDLFDETTTDTPISTTINILDLRCTGTGLKPLGLFEEVMRNRFPLIPYRVSLLNQTCSGFQAKIQFLVEPEKCQWPTCIEMKEFTTYKEDAKHYICARALYLMKLDWDVTIRLPTLYQNLWKE